MLPRMSFVAYVAVGVVYVLQHTAIKLFSSKSLHENILRRLSIALDLACLFCLKKVEAFMLGPVPP